MSANEQPAMPEATSRAHLEGCAGAALDAAFSEIVRQGGHYPDQVFLEARGVGMAVARQRLAMMYVGAPDRNPPRTNRELAEHAVDRAIESVLARVSNLTVNSDRLKQHGVAASEVFIEQIENAPASTRSNDSSFPGDPDPSCGGCQYLEYQKRELEFDKQTALDEAKRLRQLLQDLVDFNMGKPPEQDLLHPEQIQQQLERHDKVWKATWAEIGPRNARRFMGHEP